MLIRYIKFFFVLIFCFQVNSNPICIDICNDREINYEFIDENFQKPFLLTGLTFDSDVYFEASEFFYLTGLREGQEIRALDLKNAFFYLKKKNKFESISFTCADYLSGKKVHFSFKGFYSFAKLKIKGILFGKDKYYKYYQIEQGQKFDLKKHDISIEKIKKSFFSKGYFNVQVVSKISNDEINKFVFIEINIKKKNKFCISDINFEVVNHTLAESEVDIIKKKVKEKLKKLPTASYSSRILKRETNSLGEYFKQNGFPFCIISSTKKVNHQNNSVTLNFEINLGNKKDFVFVGNSYFSSNALINFLFSQGQQILDMPLAIISEEISQLYKQKGFCDVVIDSQENQNYYKFFIKEGCRLIADKFVIKGAKKFNSKYIANKFFKTLLRIKYMNDDILSQAMDNLLSFYLKQGFWDATVNKKLIPCKAPGRHVIEIFIEEGKQRYLKSISIEEFKELENEKPFCNLKFLKNPIPFDLNLLNEQHKFLTDHFKKKGFKKVDVKPDFQFDEDGHISLIWKFAFDNQALKFGKTVVQGNTSGIKFDRIINEVRFNEGDLFQKERLEDTYNQFKDFDFFNSIHIYPTNSFDFEGNKPVVLKLFPDDSFELRTRFGFQQVSKNFTILQGGWTYRAGGSFLWKNPSGNFDRFKIDADYSKYTQLFVTEYTFPYLWSIPIKSLFQFYLTKYKQPIYIGSDKTLYQISQIGFLAGISRKYTKLSFGFNTGIEVSRIFDLLPSPARAIDFSTNLLNERIPYLFWEPNIFIDQLDDKLNPSRGYLTVVSCKAMASLTDKTDYFFRFLVEQSVFTNLFSPAILGLRVRLGHIFTQRFCRLLPPYRFFLGGAFSLRSYEPDFAPPLGQYIDEEGRLRCVPQGGSTLFNSNLELRFPSFRGLEFVLFQDFGLLFNDIKSIDAKRLLSATGFGVRYFTPVGPLRFDIGWTPATKDKCSSFAWFLTLGQAF